jgi:ribosomal protein L11 methyltransferase
MPCPYEDLYIYQIEGRMDPRAVIEGESFLGHWQEENSAFLFFSAPAAEAVGGILRRQPDLRLLDSTQMAYDQWQGAPFAGERIGRFRFAPPWETAAPVDGDDATVLTVLLDPGLVFGAGTHPTTRDCLMALQQAAAECPVSTVLDLGTGTGILSLAAAFLGASVLAVDLNLLAAQTAWHNVRLNQLEKKILVIQGTAEKAIDSPADLVVANIHGEVLLRMMESEGFRQKRRFILSGLMRSDAKEARRRLATLGIRIVGEWVQDGIWHTYYAENLSTRKSAASCTF